MNSFLKVILFGSFLFAPASASKVGYISPAPVQTEIVKGKYVQYNELINDIPSARELVRLNQMLDNLDRQLNQNEAKKEAQKQQGYFYNDEQN